MKTGNFYQTIFDPDSEVFLKVYAPWCGHCKALAPTWTELEKLYEKNDKIIIGSLNAEENEMIARSIGVKGFPTILVFFFFFLIYSFFFSFIQEKIRMSRSIMKDQEL